MPQSGGVLASATPSPWARTTSGFGMIVFLASDVMLFAGFFAAYYLLRSTSDAWPPPGAEPDMWRALVFTLVLVSSSFSMIAGERCYARGDLRGLRRWLLVTVALGGAFLLNQLLEYSTLPFGIGSHSYGSSYWMLTGLHSAHVTAGLCALGLLFVRGARARHVDAISPWVSATSAFWHLVDVIWVFVFVTIWVVR